jgi:hypothetical protein
VAAFAVPLAAVALAGSPKAPSFQREVAPILANRCTGCHYDGGIAPFSLQTAASAKRHAAAIEEAVRTRRMPPWPPGPASPQLVGADARILTSEERNTLLRWARAGGPIDRAVRVATPPVETDGGRAGETVRVLELPAPYSPRKARGATDDYHCFLLDPGLDQDSFVTSSRIDPGARPQVHHVILFRVAPQQVAAAEQLDAHTPEPGWSCFGGTGLEFGEVRSRQDALKFLDDAQWIAAWAPGGGSNRLADGLGIPLAKGSRLVMQVHYNLLNGSRADRSKVVLTTLPASAGLKTVTAMLLPAPVELPCPAGAKAALCDRTAALDDLARKYGPQAPYTEIGLLLLCGKDAGRPPAGANTSCDRRIERATTILGVLGHMHLLGVSIRIELNPGRPDRRVLLDIPRWDFHWQSLYRLAEPVVAQPGDTIRVTCRHSQALRASPEYVGPKTPRYVMWGEGTTDEMCLGVLQVTRD